MTKGMFDLTGKTTVITGGNSGIGLGFAQGIAKQGGDICIWGRNAKKNQMAIDTIANYGNRVHAIAVDVADESSVDKAFAETLDVFEKVDGCFANAGVGSVGNFDSQKIEDWRQIMDINLEGLFFTLRASARHMRQRAEAGDSGGRLVGTSSIGALFGFAKHQAYAGSKGGVISIMQALAVEYARYGVTANSIVPGHIETAMTEKNFQNEKFQKAIMPRIPLRRWGKPADFEAIAAYLMSGASRYHTGDHFVIDGGFRMS